MDYAELDDESLVRLFEEDRLEPSRFDHTSHVRVAYVLVRTHGTEEALSHLRRGLRALFARSGVAAAPDRGYHDTVTRAWIQLVAATIRHHGAEADSRAFCAENPQLCSRRLIRMYYTRERLLSPQAKAGFVPPDVAPLPE